MLSKIKNQRGFTFVELIVGVAIFTLILVAVYDSYMGVFAVVKASRAKIEAINVVNEQLEIVRNLPYADVGISGGIPSGKLAHIQTLSYYAQYVVTTTVRNVDDPFDGTLGGAPNDTSPADYKLVEIQVDCPNCRNFTSMIVTTRVAPKNLETASTNGALFVRVLDGNGNPLPDADVHIENNAVNPHIVIDDQTNANGMLQVVDAPPGANAYEITVTKSGYSTDRTYAPSVSNPTPTSPHATVLLQQVTQKTFIIDRVSSIAFTSVTNTCSSIGSMDFSLTGAKLIGTGPNVPKYTQNKVTNGSGTLAVPSLEWDTYSVAGIDGTYEIVGVNPPSPFPLLPATAQNVQLIVESKNPRTLLVTVRDSATSLPLSDVSATLTDSGGTGQTAITGQGFVVQSDWSGGAGQATSTDLTRYLSSDGNMDTGTPAGSVTLRKVFGDYVSSGILTSSSFDTGGGLNFQQLLWNPIDQPAGSGSPTVRFQIASNNDGGTWNFTGPDGTASTYYTTANRNIHSSNSGNRYVRYKLFLDTVSTSTAPNISNISFTYTSSCTPPGQVFFDGLATGSYTLELSKTGYATQTIPITISASWQSQDSILIPS